ncbi:MAG: glycosyltransferase [Prevotellaceae bacterium]|nr:glycosyltransferase [Prevotellaceae bacterium]
MPVLLQINVASNWGSTGRIAEQCCEYAERDGWKCYVIYGRYSNPSNVKAFKFCSKFSMYEHYVEHKLLDNEGLASRLSTRKLVKKIKEIKPDIIHLHNIHDHWLNYKILFEYLNSTNIKIIWTFHDFWAITGHCTHFIYKECNQWRERCFDCPFAGKWIPLIKNTERNFELKQRLFLANSNLHIVCVSDWVGENVKKSFLKVKDIRVINNGIDLSIFKPTVGFLHQGIWKGKFVIMAVSSQWKGGSKGIDDYKAMSHFLKEDELIVLVGVPEDIISGLPKNIIGIRRTNNQQELAALYTRADVVVSFSIAETFGLTIVEGYACGTPAVVYDNTAPPALITPETGCVVPNRDYKAAYVAIQKIRKRGKKSFSDACIKLAEEKYDKDICFNKYLKLYNNLLNKKTQKSI